LVICVIGSDVFSSVLDQLVKGKSVQEREIVVRGLPKGDDLLACHIVCVSALEARHTAEILLRVQATSVLTWARRRNSCATAATRGSTSRTTTFGSRSTPPGRIGPGSRSIRNGSASRGAELCVSRVCERAEAHSGRTGRRAPTAPNTSKGA